METIQNVGMRIILNAPRMATGTEMRQKLGWCTLAQRRKKNWPTNVSTMLALHTSITSSDTCQMLVASETRGSYSGKLYLNRPRTEFYQKSFEYLTGRLWNSLSSNIRALDSLVTFTNACRRILHLF